MSQLLRYKVNEDGCPWAIEIGSRYGPIFARQHSVRWRAAKPGRKQAVRCSAEGACMLESRTVKRPKSFLAKESLCWDHQPSPHLVSFPKSFFPGFWSRVELGFSIFWGMDLWCLAKVCLRPSIEEIQSAINGGAVALWCLNLDGLSCRSTTSL